MIKKFIYIVSCSQCMYHVHIYTIVVVLPVFSVTYTSFKFLEFSYTSSSSNIIKLRRIYNIIYEFPSMCSTVCTTEQSCNIMMHYHTVYTDWNSYICMMLTKHSVNSYYFHHTIKTYIFLYFSFFIWNLWLSHASGPCTCGFSCTWDLRVWIIFCLSSIMSMNIQMKNR
jgi:hypothetical protein